MSLEDLIAAERARPSEPSAAEAKSLWKRIRGGAGVMVPPAFDVSPASTVVTLKMKVSAMLSTVVGKTIVATTVAGTLAGGTAAVVKTSQESESVAAKREPVAQAKTDASAKVRSKEAPVIEEPAIEQPVIEPPTIEAPAMVAAPEVQPAIEPPPTAPKPASKRRAKPTESSTFGSEFTLIKQAQRDLGSGRADAALAALAEHEQRSPKGSMTEDRLALRALALCKAGRHDEGRRAAKLLERRFPRSLYAERVGKECS